MAVHHLSYTWAGSSVLLCIHKHLRTDQKIGGQTGHCFLALTKHTAPSPPSLCCLPVVLTSRQDPVVSWYLGAVVPEPPRIPKSKGHQVPFINWYSICLSLTHILPYTLSHRGLAQTARTMEMLCRVATLCCLGSDDKKSACAIQCFSLKYLPSGGAELTDVPILLPQKGPPR